MTPYHEDRFGDKHGQKNERSLIIANVKRFMRNNYFAQYRFDTIQCQIIYLKEL